MNCCNDFGQCSGGPGCAAHAWPDLGAAPAAGVRYRVPAVKVVACSDPSLWYADLVGRVLPRRGWSGESGYKSNEPGGFTNFVRAGDGQPCEVTVSRQQLEAWPFCHVAHKAVKVGSTQLCEASCARLGVCQGLPDCEAKGAKGAKQAAEAAPGAGGAAAWAAATATAESVARAKRIAELEPGIAATPKVAALAPAGQSRRLSAIETATNIAVGFVVSLVITDVVMPLFGHDVTIGQNVVITSIFTVASVVRSYALRRLFNRIDMKGKP